MVMVYVAISMMAMIGFCSLAVDVGRVQTAKTSLRIAADSAARAAIASLQSGASTSTAKSAAVSMAANNYCDGVAVSLSSSADVAVGWWNTSTKTFSVQSNPMSAVSPNYPAVQITARRTAANGNAIPTLFAQALGVQNSSITAVSTAALVEVTAPIRGWRANPRELRAASPILGTARRTPTARIHGNMTWPIRA
jgi:Flp pilus assembly protein TadG